MVRAHRSNAASLEAAFKNGKTTSKPGTQALAQSSVAWGCIKGQMANPRPQAQQAMACPTTISNLKVPTAARTRHRKMLRLVTARHRTAPAMAWSRRSTGASVRGSAAMPRTEDRPATTVLRHPRRRLKAQTLGPDCLPVCYRVTHR